MTNKEIVQNYEARKSRHLGISIVLDLLGMFTYTIPIIGELGDIIYAPIYGISIFMMYRLRVGSAALGGVAGFTEEILPWTDFVPSALIMWTYHYHLRHDSTFKRFVKQQAKDNRVIEETFFNEYNRRQKPNIFKRIASLFYKFPEESTPTISYEELPVDGDKGRISSGDNPEKDFV